MSGTVDRKDIEALMARCQRGVGGRKALDEAHSIMAECYATLGALMLEVEQLRRRDGAHALRQALPDRATFAGWFREVPSAMSHRLWEQGGAEQRPGDVALYEIGRR